MRIKTSIISVMFFCILGQDTSLAKHLGVMGRVYPLAEPDALAEIRESAGRVDWQKTLEPGKTREALQRFRPSKLHTLPAAKASKVSLVDMTYTLKNDIPDGRGGVLYPKGYAFNPLDYMKLSSVLVVIDADDHRQVDWFKNSPHAGDFRTRLLLSSGNYYNLAEELKRPVFYLVNEVAERLHLAAVPSVVRQNGGKLEVTEILVPHE